VADMAVPPEIVAVAVADDDQRPLAHGGDAGWIVEILAEKSPWNAEGRADTRVDVVDELRYRERTRRRGVVHDIESGLAALSVDEVAVAQRPVLIAVEDDVVADTEIGTGIGIERGRRGNLEGVRLNGGVDESLRLRAACPDVGQRRIRDPLRGAFGVDDVDVTRLSADRRKRGRVEGDFDGRIDVERFHVFEERVFRERVARELGLGDLGRRRRRETAEDPADTHDDQKGANGFHVTLSFLSANRLCSY